MLTENVSEFLVYVILILIYFIKIEYDKIWRDPL